MDIPSYLCSRLARFFSVIIIAFIWRLYFGKQWKILNVIKSCDANNMGVYIIHYILLVYMITNDSIVLMVLGYWCLSPIILFVSISVVSWILVALINRSRYAICVFG